MTYILWIVLDKDIKIYVSSLGKSAFKKGIYLYIGSAKNNLRTRINRHLRDNKKIFWHIDYLLSSNNAKIKEIWISNKAKECRMAKTFIKAKFNFIPKFGSSDCVCPSHLFFIKNNVRTFRDLVTNEGFRYADQNSF